MERPLREQRRSPQLLHLDPAVLAPDPDNVRRADADDLDALAASIDRKSVV